MEIENILFLIKYIEITIFMLGICFFFIGIHNIDISYNMTYNKSWKYDLSIGGQLCVSSEIYMKGIIQCFISFILFFSSKLLSLINDFNKCNYFKFIKHKI